MEIPVNIALAISALCTPAKLDVDTATLLSASGACPARTETECRTSLCRRTDDENIKHYIHQYFHKAVLCGYECCGYGEWGVSGVREG